MHTSAINDPNFEALKSFDSLPDSAHVRVPVVAALRGCTVNTVWRHVKLGLVPAPKKLGPQITAWNVGELRRSFGMEAA